MTDIFLTVSCALIHCRMKKEQLQMNKS